METRSQTGNTTGSLWSLKCVSAWMTDYSKWLIQQAGQSYTCSHCSRNSPWPWLQFQQVLFNSQRLFFPAITWAIPLLLKVVTSRLPKAALGRHACISPGSFFQFSIGLDVHTRCQCLLTCLDISTSCFSVSRTVSFFADDILEVRCKVLQFSPHQRPVLLQHYVQACSAETTLKWRIGRRCGITL